MDAVHRELQDDYASVVPGARHVVVETGHYVQDEQPDLVVDEIQAMLELIEATPRPT
jgi:pimeloyl-ACP methyl ester carboxylesterase